MKTKAYQPKTGQKCSCRKGIERDNCPQCEGTGMRIDFRAIRLRVKSTLDNTHETFEMDPLDKAIIEGQWATLSNEEVGAIIARNTRDKVIRLVEGQRHTKADSSEFHRGYDFAIDSILDELEREDS